MAQQIVDLVGHPVTDEEPHAIALIEKMADALSVAADFFNARDEMNAAVHTPALARLSPITVVVNDAMAAWREWQFG